jgi:phosphatidylinositol phospholipase C, delta
MRALRRGCKCLELDVWEGDMGSDGIPIPVVYHGHTVTSKILFVDILRGVASYMADHPYTYPIILSLENHCSHPYQTVMALLLQEVLGTWMYVPSDQDTQIELPSPERLRGKVVIKGKRPPDAEEMVNVDASAAAVAAAADEDDPYEANPATPATPSSKSDVAGAASTTKPSKIVNELARLTLFHGTKYKEFEKSLDEPRSHMHSIGETKIGKILGSSASNTPMWRLYNVHHMTRTYPAGARVDSSNYNPLLAWSVGCQLVALNFQTSDTPLLVNDGLFRQYTSRGYVLKPPIVLGKSEGGGGSADQIPTTPAIRAAADMLDDVMDKFEDLACGDASTRVLLSKMETDAALRAKLEAKERALKETSRPVGLRIRVLSGSCLPKPFGAKFGETIDPYVEVSVHDVTRGKDAKATYSCTSNMTKAVNDNGFCPVWNETTFHEYPIYSPDVAQVQFTLYESDIGRDDKVACAAIPFSCLRAGYRSIQLYDMNNTRTGPFGMACLLVEIKTGRVSTPEEGVPA